MFQAKHRHIAHDDKTPLILRRELFGCSRNSCTKKSKDVRPWTDYISGMLERMNSGRLPIDPNDRFEGDDEIYPRSTTGFTPEETARPENWFEAHTNLEIQARHNRKHLDFHVGDAVKMWNQKSALDKEILNGSRTNR